MWNINTPPLFFLNIFCQIWVSVPVTLGGCLTHRVRGRRSIPQSQTLFKSSYQYLHHLNLNYKSQWVYYSNFVTSSQPFPSTSPIVKTSKINFTASSFQPSPLLLGGGWMSTVQLFIVFMMTLSVFTHSNCRTFSDKVNAWMHWKWENKV